MRRQLYRVVKSGRSLHRLRLCPSDDSDHRSNMISAFSSCAEMNRSGGRICSHQQLLARHLPVEWTLQIRFARSSPRASCISCPSLVPSLRTITDHCFEVWEMEGFPHLLAVITPSFQRLHILHSSQGMTDTVWTSSPCEICRSAPFNGRGMPQGDECRFSRPATQRWAPALGGHLVRRIKARNPRALLHKGKNHIDHRCSQPG